METLTDFLAITIAQFGDFELTVEAIVKAVVVVFLAFACSKLAQRIWESRLAKKAVVNPESHKTIGQFVRYGVFIFGIFLFSLIIGFDLENLLNINVFKVEEGSKAEEGKFVVTPFSFLKILVIILVAKLFSWFAQRIINRSPEEGQNQLDEGRRFAIGQMSKYIIYLIATLVALTSFGLNINVLIASSAALLVGVGLGLQNIFNDFMSGIVILFDRTIEVNDLVEIEGVIGKVKEIKLRTSEIITRASKTIIVPNHQFTSDNVVNWSHHTKESQFRVTVGVAYSSDVSRVRKLLLECADSHGDILKNPKPDVYFQDFGDNALTFDLLFWTLRPYERERIMSDLRFVIESAFRKSKVGIPFPQRDLHIVSDFRHKIEEEPNDKPGIILPRKPGRTRKKRI